MKNNFIINYSLIPFIIAFFFTSSGIKNAFFLQWVPVDLTAITALLLVCIILYRILFQKSVRMHAFVVVIAMLFIFISSIVIVNNFSDYATSKISYLSLTCLSMFVSVVLVKNQKYVDNIVIFLLMFACFMCAFATYTLFSGSVGLGRLGVFGSSSIFLGRFAGMSIIILFIMSSGRRINIGLYLFLLLFCLSSLVGSGLKSSIVGVMIVLFLYVIENFKKKLVLKTLFVTVFPIVFFMPLLVTRLPMDALTRLSTFFLEGNIGSGSGNIRLKMWSSAIVESINFPFGVGLGSYPVYFNFADLLYPHNILFEVLFEMGWVSLMIFCLIIAGAFFSYRQNIKRQDRLGVTVAYHLFIFFFLMSLSSGDINGNRLFFFFLVLGYTIPYLKDVSSCHGKFVFPRCGD